MIDMAFVGGLRKCWRGGSVAGCGDKTNRADTMVSASLSGFPESLFQDE